jgi:hypothetical protein
MGQEFQIFSPTAASADFMAVVAGVLEEGVYTRTIIGGPANRQQCSVLPLSGAISADLGFSLMRGQTTVIQYFPTAGVRPTFILNTMPPAPSPENWTVVPSVATGSPRIRAGESFILNLGTPAGDRSLRQELKISLDSLAVTVD